MGDKINGVQNSIPKEIDIVRALNLAEVVVKKNYLCELSMRQENGDYRYKVAPMPMDKKEKYLSNMSEKYSFYKVNGVVYTSQEDNLDKLNNVFNALHSIGCSFITLVNCKNSEVEIYIGTKENEYLFPSVSQLLQSSFIGNFPGSQLEAVNIDIVNNIMSSAFPVKGGNTVAAVTGIPALKKENTENFSFIQGIDKLVDSMKGKEYCVLFVSDPIDRSQIKKVKIGYENLYTQLAPLAGFDLNIGENISDSVAKSTMKSFSNAVSESISNSQSYTRNNSKTVGKTVTNSFGLDFSGNSSIGQGNNTTYNASSNIGVEQQVGAKVGMLGTGASASTAVSAGLSIGYALGSSIMKTMGIGGGGNLGRSYGSSEASQVGEATQRGSQIQKGTIKTEQDQTGETLSTNTGTSSGMTMKYEDKSIKAVLESIDEQLQRIRQCENYGMWSNAIYFVAKESTDAVIAANSYKGIMSGKETALENACVNIWTNIPKDSEVETSLNQYLRLFMHPVLYDELFTYGLPHVTASTLISTPELTINSGLPFKPINGVTVREIAEFGRSVISENKTIKRKLNLGKIFHMGIKDNDTDVILDVDSLTKHTFITGSTGSGKSNTIYQMLNCLKDEHKVKFMVIEPAKGEYKDIFGNCKDVTVYGTNPKKSLMLRINPFSFQEDIHVLEHIDRLIEIFNVCWPMYAAMPAVLKEAVERAYINLGWDLEKSTCKYTCGQQSLYPNFEDVLIQINSIITESKYSDDSKGDYIGALSMRLSSLTNGINGTIFTCDALSDKELFENNTVIDLSRVGSTETKALIMGLLVIKLQEYRMSENVPRNKNLRHITVLEEAHNILRRTSTEQNQEGSNLVGKSVEMLANAIAEMRTYGEGFIIADQAPGLMDMSVIRNTNTKIVLRLPDYADRELVGKASSLSDEQIEELAKLQTGVAAIYQNDWIEAVLCKIEEWQLQDELYNYKPLAAASTDYDLKKEIIRVLLRPSERKLVESGLDDKRMYERIFNAKLSSRIKMALFNFMSANAVEEVKRYQRQAIYTIFNPDVLLEYSLAFKNQMKDWYALMYEKLVPSINDISNDEADKILAILANQKAQLEEKPEYSELFRNLIDYIDKGKGVL